MNLRELREEHPLMFMAQNWFEGEAFMERKISFYTRTRPPSGVKPKHPGADHTAGELAVLFIANPDDPIWQRYLWTSDFDDLGQRVYVGGIGQAKKPGFQIHRHLRITQLWGWPVWT